MSMYKKLIGSLTISLLFLLSATPSFAQQNDVKVTGKITDGSGAPLAGVVVVVKDGKSNNGAVSNTQGVYEIKVPASSTLLFTCLGYTDQEVKLGASNVVNVTMTEDAQSLDEVVVVGYGTQKKKDLTGGLAVVSKQTLEMVSTNNLMDRLVGQVAGLNITTGNEAPGSNQTLLIRGQNSLTASNDPLIILDGIPYSGGLADLDPNIIENMSVLKDASAVAIYGSRGSNGVILIQTKRGSQGEFHVTYKTKLAIAEPMQRIETMGPNEFIRLKQDMGRLKNNYSGEPARSAGRFDYQRQREGKLRQGHHQRLAGLCLPHGLHDGPPAELPGRQREDHLYGLGFLPGQPRRGLQFELPAHERLCQHQPENERLAVRRSHHAVREP